jgi:hypothetical protein
MLRSFNELKNYVLEATDGEIGRCKDFLFDDGLWIIRYMVADTRKWLPGRKVLISPGSLDKPDWLWKRFPVHLSKQKIKSSPPLEADHPVSRQYEIRWTEYYEMPQYWVGFGELGAIYNPMVPSIEEQEAQLKKKKESPEGQLRSLKEVTGYHIQATDGEIGHVADFLIDDHVWVLNYIVVDTRNWLPGRKLLISPQWASAFSWSRHKVFFDLSKEKIENSPEYNPAEPPDRKYEGLLYDYYGFPPYW